MIKLLENKLQITVDKWIQHSVPSLFTVTSQFKKAHKCGNYNCRIRKVEIAQFISTMTNTEKHVFLKQNQNKKALKQLPNLTNDRKWQVCFSVNDYAWIIKGDIHRKK